MNMETLKEILKARLNSYQNLWDCTGNELYIAKLQEVQTILDQINE
jgi:hypothetical protein